MTQTDAVEGSPRARQDAIVQDGDVLRCKVVPSPWSTPDGVHTS